MKLVFLWIVVMSMLPNKLCAAGIPALLPLPQKLTWNNQSFRLSGQPEIQLDRNFDKIFSDLYLKELSPAGKNTQPKLGKPYLVILKKYRQYQKTPILRRSPTPCTSIRHPSLLPQSQTTESSMPCRR